MLKAGGGRYKLPVHEVVEDIGVFGVRRIPVIRLKRVPLLGSVYIGLVDRGTNVIQVRPHTLCNMSCVFCSVDAGPRTRTRRAEFIVDHLEVLKQVKSLADYKGVRVEALIDSVGDPITYGRIYELIRGLSSLSNVKLVSMETHGLGLNELVVDRLVESGLNRLNLSIDAVSKTVAARLSATPSYDPDKVIKAAIYAARKGLWVLLTPVWVPGVNDEEIPRLISIAKRLSVDDKPVIAIQKYEEHKWGRKPGGVKPWSWREFYANLRRLEDKYSVKLVLGPEDLGVEKAREPPKPYKVGDVVEVLVIAPGWRVGEALGVTKQWDRLITLVGVRGVEGLIGSVVHARVLNNKNNIYLAVRV